MGGAPQKPVAILGKRSDAAEAGGVKSEVSGCGFSDIASVRGPVGGMDREERDQDHVDVLHFAELEG